MSAEVPKCISCGAEAKTDGLTRCLDCRCKPHHVTAACKEYGRAVRFIQEQLWDLEPFRDPTYDRCFCFKCYPLSQPDIILPEDGAGTPYLVPRGWVGIGIAIPMDNIDFNWPTVYHGTQGDQATDILCHRHIGMPGDRLADGTLLRASHSFGRDEDVFYTSKTINYAGLQLYAAPMHWDMGEWATQVVLQCKQDLCGESILKFQQETMGFRRQNAPPNYVCDHVGLYSDTDGIEILSNRPEKCVPYRLLMRTFPGEASAGGARPPTAEQHPQGKETFRSPNDRPPGQWRPPGPPFKAKWY